MTRPDWSTATRSSRPSPSTSAKSNRGKLGSPPPNGRGAESDSEKGRFDDIRSWKGTSFNSLLGASGADCFGARALCTSDVGTSFCAATGGGAQLRTQQV
jgi:hypothetical protein